MVNQEVAIIIGTRAELIKIYPVLLELQKEGRDYYFIHTGQHGLGDFCKMFGVKTPDVILSKEPKKSSKFNANEPKAIMWNLGMLFKVRKELKKLKNLKYVLYHGDTMSTAVGSIASSRLFNPFKKYKNVHLEAGLRSWDMFEPFPEEIARKIAGFFSDILFAVSKGTGENLKKSIIKRKVINVGNTIIDSAHHSLELAKKKKVKRLSNKPFALITIHRHENLKNKKRMKAIVDILKLIEMPAFFAIHDNSRKKLEDFGLLKELEECKNINLIQPMDYVSFIYQMSECSLIVCDGGSMQEESLIFKKPCVVLRYATERQEGLGANYQYLSKLNIEETAKKLKEFSHKNFKIKDFKNPYGEKGVSKKIMKVLK